MSALPGSILTVNAGSSSLKVSLGNLTSESVRKGQFEKIGSEDARWKLERADGSFLSGSGPLKQAADALPVMEDWLDGQRPTAIAHRFVHSGPEIESHALIDEALLSKLRKVIALAPEHMPRELALLEAFGQTFADVPQVACFDTVFHTTIPAVAKTFALPKALRAAGVRCYGFHGLSYEYLVSWLRDRGEASGRTIAAHLGNGASMAALRDGVCLDTTMGLTPAGGLVMGSRCGDLDPGIFRFLAEELGMSPSEIDRTINHESGLLGLSETSGDVRDLLCARQTDPRAALAVDVFCHSAKKHLAAMAAALGGVDRVIFTGGIGEHSPEIRAQVFDGLEFLGLKLDASANDQNSQIISPLDSSVAIHVVPANEEAAMFRIVSDLLSIPIQTPQS